MNSPENPRFDSGRGFLRISRFALETILERIDKKLDWQPEDSPEDQLIPSRIYVEAEAPMFSEEELQGQLPLWEDEREMR